MYSSPTTGLSTIDCFIILSRKMADILNFENDRKING